MRISHWYTISLHIVIELWVSLSISYTPQFSEKLSFNYNYLIRTNPVLKRPFNGFSYPTNMAGLRVYRQILVSIIFKTNLIMRTHRFNSINQWTILCGLWGYSIHNLLWLGQYGPRRNFIYFDRLYVNLKTGYLQVWLASYSGYATGLTNNPHFHRRSKGK